jgi:hypothetical protein
VSDLGWIVIPQWEYFQHRDAARVVVPTWIKLYTELASNDDFLGLSFHLRGVLISLWVEYALSRRQLRGSPKLLNRRLGHTVKVRDLEALRDAGFIAFSASKPASTDTSKHASLEEKREEKNPPSIPPADDNPLLRPTEAEIVKAKEARTKNGYVENLSSYTGCRIVRGEIGISHVYDPLGTEPKPANWPHATPTKAEIVQALSERRQGRERTVA